MVKGNCMCLIFEPRHRVETLKRQTKPKIRTFYKVVSAVTPPILVRDYYTSYGYCPEKYDKIKELTTPYFYHKYVPGIIKSNRRSRDVGKSVKEINRGIHVCTTLKRARVLASQSRNRVIIEVQCDDRDLVMLNDNEAVYMKITILEESYKSGLRRLNRRKLYD